MTDGAVTALGRRETFWLGVLVLFAGQFAAIAALAWYARDLPAMPSFSGDGAAVTLVIFVSTPVQVALTAWFARRTGGKAADYLGLIWPRRNEVLFGIAAVVALIVVSDVTSWALGRNVITNFQADIYRSASGTLWLPLLFIAIVVVTPIGEETLFRGFLFRGWLRTPSDAWPVIVVTAALWAGIHLQYDWFVIVQIFLSGVLLGWLRWCTGSTLLTILLHALINLQATLETVVHAWLK
ncbi:MAG: CPBP family intramembrane metalloprotease [Rhizobiales bacterium]|nr:CPBP family intramembrane metalloprotease [Hyphomicrobiales bacterium]